MPVFVLLTSWFILVGFTDALGFLEVVSAKLKKATHARPAYTSALSINILGRTSHENGTHRASRNAFPKQPTVKVQWGHLPLNPHTTIPLRA